MRTIVRPGIVALSLAAALLCPGSVLAASPASTLDLEPSLLTADDVPAGMTPRGVDDPTIFDIDSDAYAAHGGLVAMNQIWSAPTRTGIAFIIEFRILFPTPGDAQAYLTDGEEILSEAVPSHLALVEDEAPIGVGLRHYSGQGEASGVTVLFDNFLYRVGPVAVKVFIGAFERDDAVNTAIAQAAADRLEAFLLTASVPGTSPSPGASSRPGASPIPGASPGPVASDAPGTIRQWAVSAVASSQYGSDPWSAQQATGSPDTPVYGDHPTAWAPSASEGTDEWLELTYQQAVVPGAVAVWESNASGFVTMIEAMPDGSETWMTLWQGTDPSPDELVAFSPPLTATTIATRRLRLTIDTSVPGWNEVDAVELVGVTAPE